MRPTLLVMPRPISRRTCCSRGVRGRRRPRRYSSPVVSSQRGGECVLRARDRNGGKRGLQGHGRRVGQVATYVVYGDHDLVYGVIRRHDGPTVSTSSW